MTEITYKCDQCDYTGHDKSNYNRHLKLKHDKVAPKTEAKKTAKSAKQIPKVKKSYMTLAEYRDQVKSNTESEERTSEVKEDWPHATKRLKSGHGTYDLPKRP